MLINSLQFLTATELISSPIIKSSYNSKALKWMLENQKYDGTVICSDGQSLLTSTDTLNLHTNDIRSMLESLHGKTYLHWIPGHTNVPGNEYTDRAAKEAAKLQEPENNLVPVSYEVARAVTKHFIKDKDPQHEHHVVRESYKGYNIIKADNQISNRKEGALLAQLRSGHCLCLVHYKNRVDTAKSAISTRCEEEDETVKHWIKCPASTRFRESIFRRADVGLDVISTHPKETLAYSERTTLEGL
jgi:hypothetical protein